MTFDALSAIYATHRPIRGKSKIRSNYSCSGGRSGMRWQYGVPKWYEIV